MLPDDLENTGHQSPRRPSRKGLKRSSSVQSDPTPRDQTNIQDSSQQAVISTRPNQLTETDNQTQAKRHQQPRPATSQRPSSVLLTANDYKSAGNKLCSVHRFEEAITYYSKAISKNPEVAIYFSNRALCHLKLQQWTPAIQDCRRALELDPTFIKAHFFLGQCLAETENYDESLKHLQRAFDLGKQRNINFGDDIAYQIRLVKRRRWNRIEDEASQLEDELYGYLLELIARDRDQRLEQLRARLKALRGEGCSTSENLASSSAGPAASCAGGSNEESVIETQQQEISSKCDIYIDKLDSMFSDLKLQRKKREVPDYLCGKISFEIMHDPVITPSGVTYERQDIEEHLRRVGHFDPITRQPLNASQLISNLAMREVVDAYLKENEWAAYY